MEKDFLGFKIPFQVRARKSYFYKNMFSFLDKHGKLFLLIHNIDGQMLRSKNVRGVCIMLLSYFTVCDKTFQNFITNGKIRE